MGHSFDQSIAQLVRAGYAAALGVSEEALRASVEGLRHTFTTARDAAPDALTVLVLRAPAELVVPSIAARSGRAFVDMTPRTSADFRTLDEVVLPSAPAYLLVDVDTGHDLLDVTPGKALDALRARRRSPLTIDEGVALLAQHPDILEERNAFSLLASRGSDRRVPALWTSKLRGKKGPRLGWCWEENPHSWLGSASCAQRSIV